MKTLINIKTIHALMCMVIIMLLPNIIKAQNNEFLFDSGLEGWSALPDNGMSHNNSAGTITWIAANSNFARIENPSFTFDTANKYMHIRLKNLSSVHDKITVNSHNGGAVGNISISTDDLEFKDYVIEMSDWTTGVGHRIYPRQASDNKSVPGESMIIDYIIYSNSSTIGSIDPPVEEPIVPVDNPYVGTYLPYYRINSVSSGIMDHLTHLFYFSFGPDSSGELGRVNNSGAFTHIDNLPAVSSDLNTLKTWRGDRTTKIFITIGGWVQSDFLDEVAASSTARANLAQKAKDFCIANGLDGIDIDWEGYNGAVNDTNYGLLLAAIRSAISGTDLGLSVTIGDTHTSLADEFAQADFIQLMSYGQKFGEGTQVPISMLRGIINNWVSAGADRSKIIIGLPAFAKNSANEAMVYQDIIQDYNPDTDVDMVMHDGKSYYFNGVNTIKEKSQFAIDQGLLGVMFWEQGQDVDISHAKSLLKAATDVISVNVSSPLTVNDFTKKDNHFTIFPNPFTTSFNFTIEVQNSLFANAKLYDMKGQLVWEINDFKLNGFQEVGIDCKGMSYGVYILKVSDGNHVFTKKIVKK